MRFIFVMLALFINAVLQSTLYNHIAIIGIKPNTALIFIVCYAMLRGDVEGAIVGFCFGLVQDFTSGRIVGLYALLGLLTGYFCGKPFKDFYRESLMLPIFLTAVSTVCYEFAFYFVGFLFRGNIDLFYYFGRIILPGTAYSVLMAFPVYRLVYAMNKFLENQQRNSRRLLKWRIRSGKTYGGR